MYICKCCTPFKFYENKETFRRHQKKNDPHYISDTAIKKIEATKKREEYANNPKKCVECFNAVPYFNQSEKRLFCSQSCSAIHNNKFKPKRSEESRKRTSIAIARAYRKYSVEEPPTESSVRRSCKKCEKSFLTIQNSREIFCSRNCFDLSEKIKPTRFRKTRAKTMFYCKLCNSESTFRLKSNTCDKCKAEKFGEKKIRFYDFEDLDKNQAIEQGLITSRKTLKRYLIHKRGWSCEVCRRTEWLGQQIPLELDHTDGNAGNNLPVNLQLICPTCHAQTPTFKGRNKGHGRGARGLKIN